MWIQPPGVFTVADWLLGGATTLPELKSNQSEMKTPVCVGQFNVLINGFECCTYSVKCKIELAPKQIFRL